MVRSIIENLRAVAQQCTSHARDTSDEDLSRALQELGVVLTAEALALEENFDR